MHYILSFFVIGIGLLMLLAPRAWYKVTQSWKSYSASEPSNRFAIATRIEGILFVAAGVVYVILYWVR